MNLHKLWLVARQTYLLQVRSRWFLVLTLALPLIMVVVAAVPAVTASRVPDGAVGIVDLSGRLTLPASATVDTSTLTLVPYPDEGSAEAALSAGEVQAWLLVPGDYVESGRLAFHGGENPTEGLQMALEQALRRALAPDAPAWLHDRVSDPANWRYVDLESGRELNDGLEVILYAMMPLAVAMIFVLLLSTTLNSVAPLVVREKEERAMEILLSSVRPEELVGGKLLGATMVTFLQLLIWLAAGGVAIALLWLTQGAQGWPMLRWDVLGWAALLCAPGYLLYAALAASLGILVGTREQARQMSGLLSMIAMAPLFLLSVIMEEPAGTTAVVLTLVPFFAPTLAFFRMAVVPVPVWQLGLAALLLWIMALAALWVAARLFRAAALLYGQRVSFRQAWAWLAGSSDRRRSSHA